MSKEADMKEVELNELEQEKQSMNTDTEKNGCVKVKVPEEKEVKFTGLTKEELMRVAGTTGYVLSDAPSLSYWSFNVINLHHYSYDIHIDFSEKCSNYNGFLCQKLRLDLFMI